MFYGPHTQEAREKISASKRGRPLSPQHRIAISETKTGSCLNLSPEQRAALSRRAVERMADPAAKAQYVAAIVIANRGRKWTPESIAKRTATRAANRAARLKAEAEAEVSAARAIGEEGAQS